MPKKTTTAKKTTKKASKPAAAKSTKKSASKKAASKKTTTKKPAAKKTSKAAASKKTTTKKTTKKAPAKKTAAKAPAKTTKKTASKTTAKTTSKTASAAASKKNTTAKPAAPASKTTKKAPAKPASKAPAAKADTKSKADAGKTGPDGKPNRKGITVVENRPRKKAVVQKFQPPPSTLGALLNKRKRQPLIPSGPNAPTSEYSKFGEDEGANSSTKKVKSPFKKRELDKFREILILKRRELEGDVQEMERGMAALGDRGGNPALDVAEQGSDAYDQSLSIGLADADRKLIREIDAAIERIDAGIFGVCEITHKPIGIERLTELPWTRLSIEAARDAERHGRSK